MELPLTAQSFLSQGAPGRLSLLRGGGLLCWPVAPGMTRWACCHLDEVWVGVVGVVNLAQTHFWTGLSKCSAIRDKIGEKKMYQANRFVTKSINLKLNVIENIFCPNIFKLQQAA